MVKYIPFDEVKAAVPIERVMEKTGLLAHMNKTGQYAAAEELAEASRPELVG